jgi:hypothetical protein
MNALDRLKSTQVGSLYGRFVLQFSNYARQFL